MAFAESGCPIFRATTPLFRGKLRSKRHGKLSIHFAADKETIETVFLIIISANQLSIYGAVATICEEFEAHQDRSGEPDVLMGQSIVLGEIKAEIPSQNENPSNHQILWQQYMERIDSHSPESKVSRFCMEAGFIRVVEVGQYFMTKDTGDFRQIRSVACREYTLHRARVVSWYARRFGTGQWSCLGPGSEKKWYSIKDGSPQGIWDNIAEKMLLEFAECGCPIFRATSPLSKGRLKSKDMENCRFAIVPTRQRLRLLRTITSLKSTQSLRSSRRNV